MGSLFSIGLFVQIIGITCIAGGSVGGLVLETQIWKHVHSSPEKVVVLSPLMPKYPVIIQAGTLLMLISGLIMLGSTHWVMAHQWWFIIKMILVVSLVLNGLLVAKPNAKKLQRLIPRIISGEPLFSEVRQVKKRLITFHVSEMTMLLVVYLLVIFR